MRSREALLGFIAAIQDVAEVDQEDTPKRADFRGLERIDLRYPPWPGRAKRNGASPQIIACRCLDIRQLADPCSERRLGMTPKQQRRTVEHVLGLAMSPVLRHIRLVPELCPECGSRQLSPQEGFRDDLPEIALERPVCADCGWTGKPVPVGERSIEEGDELITRIGGPESNECIIPTIPLLELARPDRASGGETTKRRKNRSATESQRQERRRRRRAQKEGDERRYGFVFNAIASESNPHPLLRHPRIWGPMRF